MSGEGQNVEAVTRKRALISLGVALHCLQDAHSHNGYGGTCTYGATTYDGSCLGHVIDSAKDSLRLTAVSNRTNPDHPAVRPEAQYLRMALLATKAELSLFFDQTGELFGRPNVNAFDVDSKTIVALSTALSTNRSKILDDGDRQECNQAIAGSWLYRTLADTKRLPSALPTASSPISKCAEVFGLTRSSYTRVAALRHRYPRLNLDAEPRQIAANGEYEAVDETSFDMHIPEVLHSSRLCKLGFCLYSFQIKASNRGQSNSLPGMVVVALSPTDPQLLPFGINVPFRAIDAKAEQELVVHTEGPKTVDYYVHFAIQPRSSTQAKQGWHDANVTNDTLTCFYREGRPAGSGEGERCRNLELKPELFSGAPLEFK